MGELRAELQEVLDGLLSASQDGGQVSLDAIGEAIGARAVTTEEIELLLVHIEATGRTIGAPQGGGGEGKLRRVVQAARDLTAELGRRPTSQEVAEHAGLTRDEVRQALMLLTIMQR